MVYHGALEATKMWAWGLRPPRSPSRGPAGKKTSGESGMVICTADPQTPQLMRVPCDEDLYSSRASSPATQRKRPVGAEM
jgi:hypothetical protein